MTPHATIFATILIKPNWAIRLDSRNVSRQITQIKILQPENFREVNCSDDEIFVSKSENESKVPASLAKLFVIEYAATFLVGRMPWKAGRRQIIHGIFHGTI